jgi:mRNA-degrading endonuclease RelE of RelBE toxin-antitoxin system
VKYKLRVTRTFEKDFRKFDIQTKRRIDSTIRMLEADPYVGKPLRADLAGSGHLEAATTGSSI